MASKNKAGRPTKLTPELQEALCERLKTCLWKYVACARVGINPSTLRMWEAQARKDRAAGEETRFTELADAVACAQAENEEQLLGIILAAAEGGDVRKDTHRAAAWILERLNRSRYGYKGDQRVELTGKDGGAIQVEAAAAGERVLGKLAGIADRAGAAEVPGESESSGDN